MFTPKRKTVEEHGEYPGHLWLRHQTHVFISPFRLHSTDIQLTSYEEAIARSWRTSEVLERRDFLFTRDPNVRPSLFLDESIVAMS